MCSTVHPRQGVSAGGSESGPGPPNKSSLLVADGCTLAFFLQLPPPPAHALAAAVVSGGLFRPAAPVSGPVGATLEQHSGLTSREQQAGQVLKLPSAPSTAAADPHAPSPLNLPSISLSSAGAPTAPDPHGESVPALGKALLLLTFNSPSTTLAALAQLRAAAAATAGRAALAALQPVPLVARVFATANDPSCQQAAAEVLQMLLLQAGLPLPEDTAAALVIPTAVSLFRGSEAQAAAAVPVIPPAQCAPHTMLGASLHHYMAVLAPHAAPAAQRPGFCLCAHAPIPIACRLAAGRLLLHLATSPPSPAAGSGAMRDRIVRAGAVAACCAAVDRPDPPELQLLGLRLLAALTADCVGWPWDWPVVRAAAADGLAARLVAVLLLAGEGSAAHGAAREVVCAMAAGPLLVREGLVRAGVLQAVAEAVMLTAPAEAAEGGNCADGVKQQQQQQQQQLLGVALPSGDHFAAMLGVLLGVTALPGVRAALVSPALAPLLRHMLFLFERMPLTGACPQGLVSATAAGKDVHSTAAAAHEPGRPAGGAAGAAVHATLCEVLLNLAGDPHARCGLASAPTCELLVRCCSLPAARCEPRRAAASLRLIAAVAADAGPTAAASTDQAHQVLTAAGAVGAAADAVRHAAAGLPVTAELYDAGLAALCGLMTGSTAVALHLAACGELLSALAAALDAPAVLGSEPRLRSTLAAWRLLTEPLAAPGTVAAGAAAELLAALGMGESGGEGVEEVTSVGTALGQELSLAPGAVEAALANATGLTPVGEAPAAERQAAAEGEPLEGQRMGEEEEEVDAELQVSLTRAAIKAAVSELVSGPDSGPVPRLRSQDLHPREAGPPTLVDAQESSRRRRSTYMASASGLGSTDWMEDPPPLPGTPMAPRDQAGELLSSASTGPATGTGIVTAVSSSNGVASRGSDSRPGSTGGDSCALPPPAAVALACSSGGGLRSASLRSEATSSSSAVQASPASRAATATQSSGLRASPTSSPRLTATGPGRVEPHAARPPSARGGSRASSASSASAPAPAHGPAHRAPAPAPPPLPPVGEERLSGGCSSDLMIRSAALPEAPAQTSATARPQPVLDGAWLRAPALPTAAESACRGPPPAAPLRRLVRALQGLLSRPAARAGAALVLVQLARAGAVRADGGGWGALGGWGWGPLMEAIQSSLAAAAEAPPRDQLALLAAMELVAGAAAEGRATLTHGSVVAQLTELVCGAGPLAGSLSLAPSHAGHPVPLSLSRAPGPAAPALERGRAHAMAVLAELLPLPEVAGAVQATRPAHELVERLLRDVAPGAALQPGGGVAAGAVAAGPPAAEPLACGAVALLLRLAAYSAVAAEVLGRPRAVGALMAALGDTWARHGPDIAPSAGAASLARPSPASFLARSFRGPLDTPPHPGASPRPSYTGMQRSFTNTNLGGGPGLAALSLARPSGSGLAPGAGAGSMSGRGAPLPLALQPVLGSGRLGAGLGQADSPHGVTTRLALATHAHPDAAQLADPAQAAMKALELSEERRPTTPDLGHALTAPPSLTRSTSRGAGAASFRDGGGTLPSARSLARQQPPAQPMLPPLPAMVAGHVDSPTPEAPHSKLSPRLLPPRPPSAQLQASQRSRVAAAAGAGAHLASPVSSASAREAQPGSARVSFDQAPSYAGEADAADSSGGEEEEAARAAAWPAGRRPMMRRATRVMAPQQQHAHLSGLALSAGCTRSPAARAAEGRCVGLLRLLTRLAHNTEAARAMATLPYFELLMDVLSCRRPAPAAAVLRLMGRLAGRQDAHETFWDCDAVAALVAHLQMRGVECAAAEEEAAEAAEAADAPDDEEGGEGRGWAEGGAAGVLEGLALAACRVAEALCGDPDLHGRLAATELPAALMAVVRRAAQQEPHHQQGGQQQLQAAGEGGRAPALTSGGGPWSPALTSLTACCLGGLASLLECVDVRRQARERRLALHLGVLAAGGGGGGGAHGPGPCTGPPAAAVPLVAALAARCGERLRVWDPPAAGPITGRRSFHAARTALT